MNNTKRTRTNSEWLQQFKEWEESGLSIAAWCKQQNECFHSFKYWRRRLCGSFKNRFPPLKSIDRSSFNEIKDPPSSDTVFNLRVKRFEFIKGLFRSFLLYFRILVRILCYR